MNFGSRTQLTSYHNESTLIDWHDYKLIARELTRSGPGEHGKAVILYGKDAALSKEVFTENGFCRVVSDKIALDRAIPDLRHPDCRKKLYHKNLPTVSVIIPVFEEHWTTLLRTITTVILRAPASLLKEIILVDDGSFKPFLKKQLDEYCQKNYPNNFVRVIHHEKRVGLIRARLTGAKVATGDVLLFLDSHVEPGTNYLPPLLEPISLDYRTVVCPFIDVIDMHNFELRPQDEGARGAFDWILNYKRLPRLPGDELHPADPFDSPVMAGGLFAISAKWFWELGGYDPGLLIWGGEQYELSFKVWMCGGRMIDTPCSRIGHIYRGEAHFPSAGAGDFLARNYRRLMDVWMDEYAEYVYKRRPYYRGVDPGDLTEQRAIRKKLNCKPFKWFMENIAFDLPKKYPPEDPVPGALGQVRIGDNLAFCLAVGHQREVILARCDDKSVQSQFQYTWRKDVALVGSEDCLDVVSGTAPAKVSLFGCHGSQGNQWWELKFVRAKDVNPVQLHHVTHQLCLEADPVSMTVSMNVCSRTALQRWHWDTLSGKKAHSK
ncbi:hypothetical protein AAHC03_016885 [Spirometra sp. Aus1]